MPLELKEHLIADRGMPRCEDVLLARAEHLGEADRGLIEAVFVRGQSVRSLAKLMRVDRRILRRRIRGLCRHLSSRRFLDATRALPYLAAEDAALARRHYCQGEPQAALASEMGISLHAVRRRLSRVSAQISLLARNRHHPGRAS